MDGGLVGVVWMWMCGEGVCGGHVDVSWSWM